MTPNAWEIEDRLTRLERALGSGGPALRIVEAPQCGRVGCPTCKAATEQIRMDAEESIGPDGDVFLITGYGGTDHDLSPEALASPPLRPAPQSECPSDALYAPESDAITNPAPGPTPAPIDAPTLARAPAEHVWPWNRPPPPPPPKPRVEFHMLGSVEWVRVWSGESLVFDRETTDEDRVFWGTEYAEFNRATPGAYKINYALLAIHLNDLRSDRV
jgi:hypothetical protein